MPAFVLLVRRRNDGDDAAGYGITATRRLGGAVARNRAKRRLRALVRSLFPDNAIVGADHVLIARPDVLTQAHARLSADLSAALAKAPKRLASAAAEAVPAP